MIQLLCKRTGASIRTVCQTMELARSSYYHSTKETPSQKADRNIVLAIQRIFKLHRSRYDGSKYNPLVLGFESIFGVSRNLQVFFLPDSSYRIRTKSLKKIAQMVL
jgi:hypothetical protein